MPDDGGVLVTLFGGTGFLGQRIAAALLEEGYALRVAVRRPERARPREGLRAVRADLHDETAVAAAVEGAAAVVNAAGLYLERGGAGFRAFHVEGAARLARLARAAGAARLVHLSGIGADAASPDAYVRSRGEGEAAVAAAFPGAILLRPSALFGPDAGLLAVLRGLVRLPVVPLFGRGEQRLQPVHVGDAAQVVVRILAERQPAPLYELGGPRAYRYAELLRLIARAEGRRPLLLPCPFALWEVAARLAELLPAAPLTRGQVALMRRDNLPSPALPGLAELGIRPRDLEALLPLRHSPSG